MTALRLSVYDIESGQSPLAIGAGGTRFIYATTGELVVAGADGEERVAADNGCFREGPVETTGSGWLFELAPLDQPLLDGASIVLSHPIELDFEGPYFFRADRVASNPGAQTPLHGHRGPGIRRLLTGRILATIGNTAERIETGRAWFETGRDWVIGRNIHSGENVFIRVMVLPAELKGGKSSFVPASPEEATRPRSVSYRLFGEHDLHL